MENDGIEIEGEVNMRLTVGEWLSSWLCREQGVQFASKNDRYVDVEYFTQGPR